MQDAGCRINAEIEDHQRRRSLSHRAAIRFVLILARASQKDEKMRKGMWPKDGFADGRSFLALRMHLDAASAYLGRPPLLDQLLLLFASASP